MNEEETNHKNRELDEILFPLVISFVKAFVKVYFPLLSENFEKKIEEEQYKSVSQLHSLFAFVFYTIRLSVVKDQKIEFQNADLLALTTISTFLCDPEYEDKAFVKQVISLMIFDESSDEIKAQQISNWILKSFFVSSEKCQDRIEAKMNGVEKLSKILSLIPDFNKEEEFLRIIQLRLVDWNGDVPPFFKHTNIVGQSMPLQKEVIDKVESMMSRRIKQEEVNDGADDDPEEEEEEEEEDGEDEEESDDEDREIDTDKWDEFAQDIFPYVVLPFLRGKSKKGYEKARKEVEHDKIYGQNLEERGKVTNNISLVSKDCHEAIGKSYKAEYIFDHYEKQDDGLLERFPVQFLMDMVGVKEVIFELLMNPGLSFGIGEKKKHNVAERFFFLTKLKKFMELRDRNIHIDEKWKIIRKIILDFHKILIL